MSRLRFLFALVALLSIAVAVSACGDSDGDGGAGGGDPQAVIDDATLEGVESGNLDVSLDLTASGKEAGDLSISLSGPFQSNGKGKLPELDLDAEVSGSFNEEDINFEGGLVLFPNSAFINYQGTDYEVDPTTFSFIQASIKQAEQQGGGEEEAATACQEAVAETDLGNFIDNLTDDGSADVEGTSTTKVSGDLDIGSALDTVVELAEDPACANQLGAVGPLPSGGEVDKAKEEVESAVKAAHADLYVGGDDIVRRFAGDLTIAPEGGEGGTESVDLAFDLTLGGVNEEQEISAPEKAKPLSDLFVKLGVNPLELAGALQGETEGLENLFESLSGSAMEGGSGGSSSGGPSDAYMKCLQEGVSSSSDLQKCASRK